MTDERARRTFRTGLILLALVGVGLGIAGYLQEAPAGDGTRFYLRSEGGAVMFDHARHRDAADGCITCHHELAGETYPCGTCHEDAEYTPELAEHGDLVEIHDSACDGCHEIAPDEEASSCRRCHAEGLADVYHQSCSACHLEVAPERFADESGAPTCGGCHLR